MNGSPGHVSRLIIQKAQRFIQLLPSVPEQ
jgi:hypothetical protein